MTETAVVRAVLHVLTLHGWCVGRQNVGGLFYAKKGRAEPAYVAFGEAGLLDISGFTPWGTHVEIECKSPTGRRKLTPDQQDRLEKLRRASCIAAVVGDAEAAQRVVYLAQLKQRPGPLTGAEVDRISRLREEIAAHEARFRLSATEYRNARDADAREALKRRIERRRRRLNPGGA